MDSKTQEEAKQVDAMVTEKLREAGADIPVILGGIVPETDFQSMYDSGVARVLTPGATSDEVVEAVRSAIAERQD